MKDVIIVCDDFFGLNVQMIIEAINQSKIFQGKEAVYNIKGFLCSHESKIIQNKNTLPIIGEIENWCSIEDEYYVMGIVNPISKYKNIQILKNKGAKFITLIAPWVLVPPTVKFGEGCIISATSIKESAKIGDYVILYECMVGGNAVLGNYSSVMAYANITSANIGEKVYVGANAVILENKYICKNTYIYPNSVVVKNIKVASKMLGIPARKIK